MSLSDPATRSEVEAVFSEGLRLHQSGRLAEAEAQYRKVLAIEPAHLDSLNLMGVIALQTDRNEAALDSIGKAIALNDRVADYHNNIAEAYRRLRRPEEALVHYSKAAALDPDFMEARFNLGRMLVAQGRAADAIEHLRLVIARAPEHAEARLALADALFASGVMEAGEQYQKVLQKNPKHAVALRRFSRWLLAHNKTDEAFAMAWLALQAEDSDASKEVFLLALVEAKNFPTDDVARQVVVRAMREPWARPETFAPLAIGLVKSSQTIQNLFRGIESIWPNRPTAEQLFGPFGLGLLAKDEVLRALLELAVVADGDLERLFMVIRSLVLQAASGGSGAADPNALTLYSALARQCFNNDFVYFWPDGEREQVDRLRTNLAAALKSGAAIDPVAVIALGCYMPLHVLPNAEALLQRSFPTPVAALIVQQVKEPLAERADRPAIASLTPIDDEISLRVQQQYEENPYPSWVLSGLIGRPKPFNVLMHERFPHVTFQDLPSPEFDLLIAGCGTGRHSIETAKAYREARVLAIDLSRASLAYARRKTVEAGLTNLEYAQADILKLGAIDRRFDVIESSGVLHHLADPFEGWRVLLSLLRPGGFMRLGFYSERARVHIRAARQFIRQGGYESSPDGIRRCRQILMASKDETLRAVTASPDFYTTSACRDLLFHVQEHQMTLPEIETFLKSNELQLLGFEGLPPGAYRDYSEQFPEDKTLTDLKGWDAFEAKHPHLFGGMYSFWIQKPA